MNKDYNFHSLIENLYALQKKSDKIPREYGKGTFLYTSEIHLLDLISKFPNDNISEIASRMMVTKMSVSMQARKLQKKGFLKILPGRNKKELKCSLTEKGENSVLAHENYHKEENIFLTANLSAYSKSDINLVENFLLDYAQYLEVYLLDETML